MSEDPMRTTYPLEVVSGHLIVDFQGTRGLLDTGAPVSIGPGTLECNGQRVRLLRQGFGVSPEYLSEKVGTRIDALVGTDVLATHYFEVDYAGATCTFATERPELAGHRIPLDHFLRTPIADAVVDSQPARMIVDTGAQFGYIAKEFVAGRRPLETRHDFHPTLGDFTTEVHQLPITVGGRTMSLLFGVMPRGLEEMLGMIRTQGIIGTDLFRRHRTWFALPDGAMVLEELAA